MNLCVAQDDDVSLSDSEVQGVQKTDSDVVVSFYWFTMYNSIGLQHIVNKYHVIIVCHMVTQICTISNPCFLPV